MRCPSATKRWRACKARIATCRRCSLLLTKQSGVSVRWTCMCSHVCLCGCVRVCVCVHACACVSARLVANLGCSCRCQAPPLAVPPHRRAGLLLPFTHHRLASASRLRLRACGDNMVTCRCSPRRPATDFEGGMSKGCRQGSVAEHSTFIVAAMRRYRGRGMCGVEGSGGRDGSCGDSDNFATSGYMHGRSVVVMALLEALADARPLHHAHLHTHVTSSADSPLHTRWLRFSFAKASSR